MNGFEFNATLFSNKYSAPLSCPALLFLFVVSVHIVTYQSFLPLNIAANVLNVCGIALFQCSQCAHVVPLNNLNNNPSQIRERMLSHSSNAGTNPMLDKHQLEDAAVTLPSECCR